MKESFKLGNACLYIYISLPYIERNPYVILTIQFTPTIPTTKTYNYPIPNKILKIRQIQGYNYFSKFDCKSGFYHLKLEEESKKLTAFTVPVHYVYLR